MSFDFASAKKLARKTVHETLSVRAFYKDSSISEPLEISVRWHDKQILNGALQSDGYAEILEGINKLIFNITDARTADIKRGGMVSIIGLKIDDADILPVFTLDSKLPSSGPYEEIWNVTAES